MTEVDIHDYPPYKMTDAQAAATVGRFQEHQEPTPAPNIDTEDHHEVAIGRTPAAPPGVVYTGDVYATDKGEPVSAHAAAVAAYPENVRSSVPDAVEVTEGSDEPEEPEPEAAPVEDTATEDAEAAAEAERAAAEAAAAEAAAQAEVEAAAEAQRVEAERVAAEEAQRAADAAQAEAEREAASAREREAAAEAEREAARVDWNERTVAELRVELSNRGIDYDYSARKADLVALLESHATAA